MCPPKHVTGNNLILHKALQYSHKLRIITFNFKHALVAGDEQESLHYLVGVRWTLRSAASLVEDVGAGVTVGGVRATTAAQTLGVTAVDTRVDRVAGSQPALIWTH